MTDRIRLLLTPKVELSAGYLSWSHAEQERSDREHERRGLKAVEESLAATDLVFAKG